MPARRLDAAGPRPAGSERLLADLALMETAGLRASIELRGFGLHALADSLCAEIDHLHAVRNAAATRLRGAVRTEEACDG